MVKQISKDSAVYFWPLSTYTVHPKFVLAQRNGPLSFILFPEVPVILYPLRILNKQFSQVFCKFSTRLWAKYWECLWCSQSSNTITNMHLGPISQILKSPHYHSHNCGSLSIADQDVGRVIILPRAHPKQIRISKLLVWNLKRVGIWKQVFYVILAVHMQCFQGVVKSLKMHS